MARFAQLLFRSYWRSLALVLTSTSQADLARRLSTTPLAPARAANAIVAAFTCLLLSPNRVISSHDDYAEQVVWGVLKVLSGEYAIGLQASFWYVGCCLVFAELLSYGVRVLGVTYKGALSLASYAVLHCQAITVSHLLLKLLAPYVTGFLCDDMSLGSEWGRYGIALPAVPAALYFIMASRALLSQRGQPPSRLAASRSLWWAPFTFVVGGCLLAAMYASLSSTQRLSSALKPGHYYSIDLSLVHRSCDAQENQCTYFIRNDGSSDALVVGGLSVGSASPALRILEEHVVNTKVYWAGADNRLSRIVKPNETVQLTVEGANSAMCSLLERLETDSALRGPVDYASIKVKLLLVLRDGAAVPQELYIGVISRHGDHLTQWRADCSGIVKAGSK